MLAASWRLSGGCAKFYTALDRDFALRPEFLADIGVIAFAVEFGVRKLQPAAGFQ